MPEKTEKERPTLVATRANNGENSNYQLLHTIFPPGDWPGEPLAPGEKMEAEIAKAGTTAENAALRARVKKLEALKTHLLNENMGGADCNRKLRARVKELEKAVEQPLANLGGGVWSEPADVVLIEQRLFEIADAVPDEDMAKLPEDLSERFEEHLASAEEIDHD